MGADSVASVALHEVDTFDAMVAELQMHFERTLARNGDWLFWSEASADLNEVFLGNLPASERQDHTCHACSRFLHRYGALVSVNDDGSLTPAVWTENVPEPYRAAMAALAPTVARGQISGLALFSEAVWGKPEAGGWTHIALRPPEEVVFRDVARTAAQAMAAKLEDFRTLQHGLAEFDRATVAQAVTLLEAESLYRSEKVSGPARFLLDLHDIRERYHGRQRDNLIWRAVAGAPPGFCQPRSTMIGTLLEDIAAGHDFASVKRRFDAKMHPLQYQRPQAAPSAGNIQQAEKLVEQLGIASALRRRFARLEEIEAIWRPAVVPDPEPSEGVFGHLRPKSAEPQQPLTMTPQAITWTKFARTVLPQAQTMAVHCTARMNLCALLTAADPEAKPILQWDNETQRNQFSAYVYPQGSRPEQWGLTTGSWVRVTAVTLQPWMWGGEDRRAHHGKSAIFVLEGARDNGKPGLCLFPEILQSSLHGIRATVEAYSRSRQPEGQEEASASGLWVGAGGWPNQIRVTTPTGVATYTIDRWD